MNRNLTPKSGKSEGPKVVKKEAIKSEKNELSIDSDDYSKNNNPLGTIEEIEDAVVDPKFQTIFNNLNKVDHDYLKKVLEKENEEFGNQLLAQIEELIMAETVKIQRANLKNKDLKKNIKNCELELKVQKKMQDSDFKELQDISKHREELSKFQHEKTTLDKGIYDTKKKINDVNLEIQTLLTKIEANATYFNDLPEESKAVLIKEIQDNKLLSDFIKSKSFLKKFVN